MTRSISPCPGSSSKCASDHRLEDERAGVTVPGDVDVADEATLRPGRTPSRDCGPPPGSPSRRRGPGRQNGSAWSALISGVLDLAAPVIRHVHQRDYALPADQDRLEVLARAAAGAPVHVPLEPLVQPQSGPLEDLGVEPAAVVDDDADRRAAAAARPSTAPSTAAIPPTYSSIAALLVPRAAAPSSRSRRSSSPSSS